MGLHSFESVFATTKLNEVKSLFLNNSDLVCNVNYITETPWHLIKYFSKSRNKKKLICSPFNGKSLLLKKFFFNNFNYFDC